MQTTAEIMLHILEKTKNGTTISNPDEMTLEVLRQFDVAQNLADEWVLSRDARIRLAISAASRGVDIERIVNTLTWKDFEGLVAAILEKNGFSCIESLRRRGDSHDEGMEIDVIGVRDRRVIAVDAKMWASRTGKASALRQAAERQAERTRQLALDLNILRKKMPTLAPGPYDLYPVLVTWLVEDVVFHLGVPVVPVFKLNSFIVELPVYEEQVVSYRGELPPQ
ncbi:MAG: restriction endonuclease [Candidatus Thorarchaeota archaeon]